jgi:hypothetical protein
MASSVAETVKGPTPSSLSVKVKHTEVVSDTVLGVMLEVDSASEDDLAFFTAKIGTDIKDQIKVVGTVFQAAVVKLTSVQKEQKMEKS